MIDIDYVYKNFRWKEEGLYRKSPDGRTLLVTEDEVLINGDKFKMEDVAALAMERFIPGGRQRKHTHCDICGEPLPEEEIRKQTATHYICWKKWVKEKRAKSAINRPSSHDLELVY